MISAAQLQTLLDAPDRGQPDWWQQIANLGTPLRTLLESGQQRLTFLWRDPVGDESASEIGALYIDMYSHTPHLTRQLTGFERVAGTDIWCWQTDVATDWIGSYLLLPVLHNHLPAPEAPSERRRWWIELMPRQASSDPLNPNPGYDNGWGVPLSAILPDNQQTLLTLHDTSDNCPPSQPAPEYWQPCSDSTRYRLWHFRPGTNRGEPRPLVLLLDGHYWAGSMPLFASLEKLTADQQLPPAHYLFLDAVSSSQRAEDLPCNRRFWQQLIDQQLTPLQQQGLINAEPQQRLVAGQSFGGLAAIYACLHWPDQFGLAFSQSGSFWWPDPAETSDGGWLVQQLRTHQLSASSPPQRIRLEVGQHETDMIGVNRALHSALSDAGFHSDYYRVPGGHDWLCWRSRLLSGLQSLLSPPTTPTH